jgi:hypothetical protein
MRYKSALYGRSRVSNVKLRSNYWGWKESTGSARYRMRHMWLWTVRRWDGWPFSLYGDISQSLVFRSVSHLFQHPTSFSTRCHSCFHLVLKIQSTLNPIYFFNPISIILSFRLYMLIFFRYNRIQLWLCNVSQKYDPRFMLNAKRMQVSNGLQKGWKMLSQVISSLCW